MSEITAIINVFRRPHILKEQIQSIMDQTVKPKEIFIWNNGNKEVNLEEYKKNSYFKVFDNNYNSGVWSRFIIGFLAETEYVCVFDDDTIPGKKWFENCIDCMNKKEALYGTIGVIFNDSDKYEHGKRYGWANPIEKAMPVDIVGHSWFFKRDWLSYLTRDKLENNTYFSVGEDMYFSHVLHKYASISTYVPPHPINDLEMFGSNPNTGYKYGCDGNTGSNIKSSFHDAYNGIQSSGFTNLVKRLNATSITDFDMFLKKMTNMEPFALIRPADGEYQVLMNYTLTNIDSWTFLKGGKLKTDLDNAINMASKNNCYVGIPCECCSLEMGRWYVNTYKMDPKYLTFANIFVNNNWKKWIGYILNNRIQFTFIGPNKLPANFCVEKYVNIPLYLVNSWDKDGDNFINMILKEIENYKNKIVMFAGGPVSKIAISKCWEKNPNNIYLDVGSSLDYFMKGSSNRVYTNDENPLSKKVCRFSSKMITI